MHQSYGFQKQNKISINHIYIISTENMFGLRVFSHGKIIYIFAGKSKGQV